MEDSYVYGLTVSSNESFSLGIQEFGVGPNDFALLLEEYFNYSCHGQVRDAPLLNHLVFLSF